MNKKILNHLEKNKIKYEILEHKTVYTAFDAASTLHRPLKEIVKCLLVKVSPKFSESDLVMVLVGADKMLDFKKLAKILRKNPSTPLNKNQSKSLGAGKLEIAQEKTMKKFEKNGHISSLGSLYKLPIVMDKNLTKNKKAVFPAGSFTESLLLSVKDYIKIEKPIIGIFTKARKK